MTHWLDSEAGRKFLSDEYVDAGRSANDIAKQVLTYPNRVLRAVKRHGFVVRDRSEARKEGIRKGRLTPPMLGRTHSEETRTRISEGVRRHHGTEVNDGEDQEGGSGSRVDDRGDGGGPGSPG